MTVGPSEMATEEPEGNDDARALLAEESATELAAPDAVAEPEGAEGAADDEGPVESPPIPWSPLLYVTLAVLTALSFVSYGFEPKALVVAFAACALAVLSFIDVEHRLLPNRIVLPAFGIVLVAQLAIEPDRAVEWLVAGPAAAAFLAAPLVVRRDAMGLGDVKLALLLGAAVGWKVFLAIVLGCFAMLPFAAAMLVRSGSIKGATLPFGPFLAFGTVLILLAS